MSGNPFFSICIPTFNRPADLKPAMNSFLRQSFTDYEIIVSDNSDTDASEKVCASFGDGRIRYGRNGENIGFARNLYKVIKQARGEYIFLFGDDDLVLNTDTLQHLYTRITKHHYGYIRLIYFYHKDLEYLFDFNNYLRRTIPDLKKQSSNVEVLKFLYGSFFSLISGNVFKNSPEFSIPVIEQSTDPDFQMEDFWGTFLYTQAKRYGAHFDTDDPVLVKWLIHRKNLAGASADTPGIYDVRNNRMPVERSWNLALVHLTASEQKQWIKEQLRQMILILPSIKYYSSNRNLLRYVKRMSELDPSVRYLPQAYLCLVIALLMPRPLWNILRGLVQKAHIIRDPKLNREVRMLKEAIAQ